MKIELSIGHDCKTITYLKEEVIRTAVNGVRESLLIIEGISNHDCKSTTS